MTKTIRLFLAILLLSTASVCVGIEDDPVSVVRDTSNRALAEMASREDELTKNPGRIYDLIDQIVLPRFDFERMSRLVLGKYWRRASGEQRAAFVAAFRELLVRTYATALLNYSGQKIQYLPTRNDSNTDEVLVQTEVAEEGAKPIPIGYNLYRSDAGWKVFDVVIDGISLVSNYRTSFASQVRRYGLDGLIAKLEQRNSRDK